MKKLLSVVLAVMMLLGTLSVTAFATDNNTTEITATVANPLSYEMVIPSAVSMTEAGVKAIGTPSVKNVKHATEKTVISYTASGTQLTLEGGTATMATSYYTDSTGTTALTIDAIKVYENNAVVDPLTTLYVGVAPEAWDAAENGTYKATVTFNFAAEEVVTIADILPEDFPVSTELCWWQGGEDHLCDLYVQDGNLIAQYEELSISVPVKTILTPTGDSYTYTDSGVTWTFTMKEESWNSSITISGCTGSAAKLNGDYTESM